MTSPKRISFAICLICLAVVVAGLPFSGGYQPEYAQAQFPVSSSLVALAEDDDDREYGHDRGRDDDEGEEAREDEEEWSEDGHGDRENEEWEEHLKHLEIEEHHLRFERVKLEAAFGGLELVDKLHQIAENRDLTAAFAVLRVKELMDPHETAQFLLRLQSQVKNRAIQRLICVQLAEIYANQQEFDRVREQLTLLILGADKTGREAED